MGVRKWFHCPKHLHLQWNSHIWNKTRFELSKHDKHVIRFLKKQMKILKKTLHFRGRHTKLQCLSLPFQIGVYTVKIAWNLHLPYSSLGKHFPIHRLLSWDQAVQSCYPTGFWDLRLLAFQLTTWEWKWKYGVLPLKTAHCACQTSPNCRWPPSRDEHASYQLFQIW